MGDGRQNGGEDMVVYENECVDCGLPCLGNACPYRNVARRYCDKCKEEIFGDYYEDDGDELCACCLLERFRVSV